MIDTMSKHSFKVAFVAILLAAIYWGVFASDRYVSEANVIVDSTELGAVQSSDFAGILTGNRGSSDLMFLRDHLLSVDMLQKIDATLGLRGHYGDTKRDVLSRMWFQDSSIEFFHRHYHSRVSIEVDSHAGVLRIAAQAYTPEMAHSIAKLLVEEGEKFMNELGHRIAREQVAFLEKQVAEIHDRLMQARRVVVDFQNANIMVSPQRTLETIGGIIARMEGQIAELKSKREAMLGYLSPKAPDVVDINHQIAALGKQVALEKTRLASPEGQALNRTLEEYQRLEMEAGFVQTVYNTALGALEKGRIEATRTLKKVSILQSPTLPQYPMEPRRVYNTFLFALSMMVLSGIIRLLTAIIREHKD